MMGYENTLPVTVDDIIYHTKAVTKARKKALVVADMRLCPIKVSLEEQRKRRPHDTGRRCRGSEA